MDEYLTLSKETIDSIFEWVEEEGDAKLEKAIHLLYGCAFEEWESVKDLEGYPSVSQETWDYIIGKFMDMRDEHGNRIELVPGWTWTNVGFSVSQLLPSWKIDSSYCKITYKEAQ